MSQNRKRQFNRPAQAVAAAAQQNKSSLNPWLIGGMVVLVLAVAAYFLFFRSPGGSGGAEIATASGLKYVDQVVGTGASPSSGKKVTVHYTGTLENGEKFDSSVDRGTPLTFNIGQGAVIKGWDEGIMSMKIGGKRKLIIPGNLGYGAAGNPPKIGPNATLLFDVELLKVE